MFIKLKKNPKVFNFIYALTGMTNILQWKTNAVSEYGPAREMKRGLEKRRR